jgi:hypothetical protein
MKSDRKGAAAEQHPSNSIYKSYLAFMMDLLRAGPKNKIKMMLTRILPVDHPFQKLK